MKKKIIIITSVIMILIISFMIGTGLRKRTDVVLGDYSVSEDGTEMNLDVQVSSSMGYIRGLKDKGGGVKPHYLTFYSTFGGLNSSLGSANSFMIELGEDDTEIYFNRPKGGYELVLVKDEETGQWHRPGKNDESTEAIELFCDSFWESVTKFVFHDFGEENYELSDESGLKELQGIFKNIEYKEIENPFLEGWYIFEFYANEKIYSLGITGNTINIDGKFYEVSDSIAKDVIAIIKSEPVKGEESWGITLTAENVTPSGMTIRCIQSGGEPTGELNTGSWYILENWTPENEWKEMPYVIDGEIAWTSEAWIIPMNDSCEWEVNWEWLYGQFPAGKYRVGKEIMDFKGPEDFDKEVYYAEFVIESTDEKPEHSDLYVEKYTLDDVLSYFEEVVLRMEYSDGTGDTTCVQKWLSPIYYQLYGSYKDADMSKLYELFTKLNNVEGFPGIYPATDTNCENLTINFLEPNDFIIQFSDVINGEDAYGAAEFWYYTETNEIYTARIGYRTDIDQNTRNSILLEEIMNVLGISDSELRTDSIVYQYSNENTALSDVDILIFKLLYNPKIKCGMNYDNCTEIIKELYY